MLQVGQILWLIWSEIFVLNEKLPIEIVVKLKLKKKPKNALPHKHKTDQKN